MTTWPPPGIRWYYSDDAVAIAHADCRDVLPLLEPVDLVLTDPPYGMDYQSAWRTAWNRKDKIQGDSEFPLWLFDMLHPRVAMFVFCRWDILPILPSPKSFIVWDKGSHSMGDLRHEFARQWEAVCFYPGPSHAFRYRPKDIIRAMRIAPDQLVHPNEKPAGILRPLIDCHDAQTVLDPFCGSGTTLRATKDLGRRAIGIEIEERYCEIAAKRMAQSVMELGL